MRPRSPLLEKPDGRIIRIRLWYGFLLLICAIFILRLFYLQVIRHDYYQKNAQRGQLKQYEIPAARGAIMAHNGNSLIPLVLNETRYTLFADPSFVKDAPKVAGDLQAVIGGDRADIEKKLKTPDTRYIVLSKKLSKEVKDKVDNLKIKGIGTRGAEQRIYSQGASAGQLLGFVDDEGVGKYGIEQALNSELSGVPGQLKAVTDAQGIPLVDNKDNINTAPKDGKQVVLTIDVGMQQQMEEILKSGLDHARSTSGSALILDASTGAVKAMANYPTYNPAEFFNVSDASLFANAAVSSPMEVGSVMKTLTAAAALDQGVVKKSTTYYDPAQWKIDDATVRNVEEDGGPGSHSIADILQLSLNTGATWLLMQMGGGEINQKARTTWHDYLVNRYQFGRETGIEQGYEAAGSVPDPISGFGLNIQFANTTFGQGFNATPLQMGSALASVLNGGTYYQPHLIDSVQADNGQQVKKQPKIIRTGVVKPEVGTELKQLMEYTLAKNYPVYNMSRPRPEYSMGGKTGTAEVPKPGGGYYDDRYNGTYVGFVGGDKVQYIIVVRVNEPKIAGYAGSKAAAPIYGKMAVTLIDNFGVTPRSGL